MVSALVPGARGLGSSRGHCVVFLGKTFNSHSASFHPEVFTITYLKIQVGSNGIQISLHSVLLFPSPWLRAKHFPARPLMQSLYEF